MKAFLLSEVYMSYEGMFSTPLVVVGTMEEAAVFADWWLQAVETFRVFRKEYEEYTDELQRIRAAVERKEQWALRCQEKLNNHPEVDLFTNKAFLDVMWDMTRDSVWCQINELPYRVIS